MAKATKNHKNGGAKRAGGKAVAERGFLRGL